MIPCAICNGSKISPWGQPHPCGACFGTGESTAPYDREWNATTVTKTAAELGDLERSGVRVEVSRPAERTGFYIALIAWRNPLYKGHAEVRA